MVLLGVAICSLSGFPVPYPASTLVPLDALVSNKCEAQVNKEGSRAIGLSMEL
ncbi:hypothetical protein J5N97_017072 [Dioscorea zingiberensis]|uniref:Uncharacterized protein n=1 Tax=Dioscorea zingiberensis TaxID=325984 RepID=A0A9D5HG86_9LILI|nr:hypothetical protein J5N97_017072 [Dioscorea zingiberensis]